MHLTLAKFESLVQINSIEGKATADLSPLLDIVQTGFSQVAENIERLRLPQTSKPEGSEISSSETQKSLQSGQSEQDKPLSPFLQEFVTLYNADDNAKLRQIYKQPSSIRVTNETERFQNPNVPPVFQTKSNGSLCCVRY